MIYFNYILQLFTFQLNDDILQLYKISYFMANDFFLTRNHFEFLIILHFFFCNFIDFEFISIGISFDFWYSFQIYDIDPKNQRRGDPIYSDTTFENLLFAIATWYSAAHVVSKMATENVRADENRGRKYRRLSGESQDGNRFGRI